MSSVSGHAVFSSFEALLRKKTIVWGLFWFVFLGEFWVFFVCRSGNYLYCSSECICIQCITHIYSFSTHIHILNIFTDILHIYITREDYK